MRTVKTLKPGQKRTQGILTRFGPSLLYVRYRCDEARREHAKTVELVVQRRSREGESECPGSRTSGARVPGARSRGPGPVRPGGWHCGSAGGRDLQQRLRLTFTTGC